MRKFDLRKIFVSIFIVALIAMQGANAQQQQPAMSKMQTMMQNKQPVMSNMQMMQNHADMMFKMLGPADKNYDLRFIDMMIMHHQGAIKMSQDALCKAQHPELMQKAQDIINAQTLEIQQLETWRQQWYGQ